jgi:hypothetical protein
VRAKQTVVIDGSKTPAGAEVAMSREVPTDPAKGSDFALAIGYQTLLKSLGDKR